MNFLIKTFAKRTSGKVEEIMREVLCERHIRIIHSMGLPEYGRTYIQPTGIIKGIATEEACEQCEEEKNGPGIQTNPRSSSGEGR